MIKATVISKEFHRKGDKTICVMKVRYNMISYVKKSSYSNTKNSLIVDQGHFNFNEFTIVGWTIKNDSDKDDQKIAERIAESRARTNIYSFGNYIAREEKKRYMRKLNMLNSSIDKMSYLYARERNYCIAMINNLK